MRTSRLRKSTGFLVVAELSVAAQVMLFLPPPARAASSSPAPMVEESSGEGALAALRIERPEPAPQEPEAVNKTVPEVEPPPEYPTFSPIPTDEEITKARVFGEPLYPEAGERDDAENQALAQAITAYLHGGDSEALEPLEGVVTAFPQSRWRVAVQANVGSWYERKGYFTRAERNLSEAWRLGKDSQTEEVRRLAEFAAGELMLLHAQFGQLEPLEALVAEFAGRESLGPISQKLYVAQTTVWGLRNDHENAVPSASTALERVRFEEHRKAETRKKSQDPSYERQGFTRHAELARFPPSHDGATLAEAKDLADLTDLKLRMARRQDPNAEIPLPAVVHFKPGHFAAVVEKRGDRYRLDDPLLGGEVWMSREAIEEESSGYFLIEQGEMPQGWRAANRQEAGSIRGKCGVAVPDLGGPRPNDVKEGGDGTDECGLAMYDFNVLQASLHVYDTPVGCSTPRGPSTRFTVHYNQREGSQPQSPAFSNLGPRWTFEWLAYVEDDPTAVGEPVTFHSGGGGSATYEGFENGHSKPEHDTRAILEIVSTSPIVYERHLTDGSTEVFSESDGAATAPRRVFMTERRDSAGNALTFTYDAQLRLVSMKDAIDRVTTLTYGLAGDPLKITRVTDPYGRSARFDYDDQGRLLRITDVIGMTSEFEYGMTVESEFSTFDFIRALTTPYGRTTFRNEGIENGDRWVEATDPLGGTERIEHLLKGTTLTPATAPASEVPVGFSENEHLNTHLSTYFSKLAMSRLTSDPPDPDEGTTYRFRSYHLFWISGFQLHSIKHPLENRVWFDHDADWIQYEGGILNGEILEDGVSPVGRPVRIGRVLDDGTSQIHRFEWNLVGKPTRYTDPLGREQVFVYGTGTTPDPEPSTGTGLDLLEVRHKNGNVYETLAEFTYNSDRRVLTATDALGNFSSYTYNDEGQVLTATSPGNASTPPVATTTWEYDEDGYLQSVTGPAPGSTTTYTYDGFGRVDTITPPLEDPVAFDYDDLDRLTRITFEDQTYQEIVYHRLDPERSRDRLGRWSQSRFDAVRRPTAETDPEGRTVKLQWCDCDFLESLIDANGNRTSWEYDIQGRVTKEIRANGAEYLYGYEDTTSRLETVADPRAIVSTYEYFLDDRLKEKSYSDATPAVSFTYDYRGRLETAANGTDTLSWTYDLVGRVLSESSTFNSSLVEYTYDEAGNRKTLDLDSTPFVAYDYDNALRLESITRGADVFAFDYDAASRRTSMVYPNEIETTYTYDGESRIERITAMLAQTVITDFQYTYNAVGNRTQKVTPDLAETYAYDRADQLVEVVRTGTAANRWHYAYDPAGNRTTEQIGNSPVQASYDNMNRLLSTSAGGALAFKGSLNEPGTVTIDGEPAEVDGSNAFQGAVESSSGTNTVTVVATDASDNTRTDTYEVEVSGDGIDYDFDENGNLIEKDDGTDVWTYEWNVENRLIEVLENAQTVATFAYDPRGRRVEKVIGATTTTFTYAGEDILRESTGGTTTYYVHGPGTDEPLAKEVSGAATYYHADGLGSILKLTDAAGDVAQEYRYDTFGRIEAGSTQGGYSFTGREWDPEAGLFYYRARYYDPQQGRFISEDPIGFRGGFGFYTYSNNSPPNFVDPNGLESITFTVMTVIRPPDFESGLKTAHQITVDSNTGDILPGSELQFIGDTFVFGRAMKGKGKLDVSVSGGDGCIRVRFKGEAKSWFLRPTPFGIDYDLSITYNEDTGETNLSGEHDGYPSYEVWKNDQQIYDHQQGHPGELLGSGDVPVNK